jgi:16S rRNA (uracil1498-N3)-methyltransferase
MHRFYLPDINIAQNKIIINDKDAAHHIKNVLRLKEKDKICIFDGKGNEYDCAIDKIAGKIVLEIKQRRWFSPKNEQSKIAIACAIPKHSKMDDIVDKLTQLGVDRIIPLETERVVVRLDKQKKVLRQKRWEKIVLNASQQSQRKSMPIIDAIKDIKEVLLHSGGYDLKIMPTLIGERQSLKEVLSGAKPKNILALIGPEGDFTEEEVEMAKKVGFIPVTLGNLVLRVETAAIAVASFIRFYANH